MRISLDRRAVLAPLAALATVVVLLAGLAAFALLATPAAAGQAPAATAAQAEDEQEAIDEDLEEEEEELDEVDEELDDLGDESVEEEAPDEQVIAIERATGALGRAKRAAAARLARLGRGSAALAPCRRGGPGWKRIRAVRHPSQRNLYAAAARKLLADMQLLLDRQQPQILAYQAAFERFVGQLRAAPVGDETLRAAIAAQGRRLASYRDVGRLRASCKVFNKLTRRVREFPTRSAAQIVRADYRAAPIARGIERHLSDALRRIDRRHGIDHRDAATLADAADRLVELGGEPGYATGFQYALSLR